MKNMNKITGLLRTSALCLTLAAMAACDAEDFTRTAGDIPGKDDLANVGGVLRREKTPDQISSSNIICYEYQLFIISWYKYELF